MHNEPLQSARMELKEDSVVEHKRITGSLETKLEAASSPQGEEPQGRAIFFISFADEHIEISGTAAPYLCV